MCRWVGWVGVSIGKSAAGSMLQPALHWYLVPEETQRGQLATMEKFAGQPSGRGPLDTGRSAQQGRPGDGPRRRLAFPKRLSGSGPPDMCA